MSAISAPRTPKDLKVKDLKVKNLEVKDLEVQRFVSKKDTLEKVDCEMIYKSRRGRLRYHDTVFTMPWRLLLTCSSLRGGQSAV